MKRLAIVGGGAAGLAAAIAAGDAARTRGMHVDIAVFERDDRVGRSILATGNGRCNFSNETILSCLYHNGDFVESVYSQLKRQRGDDAVMDFFEGCGLEWRQEADGRRYPLANKASVVVDVLRAAARHAGVREVCNWSVASIVQPKAPGKPFTLHRADGVLERADAVILACGGRALQSVEVEGLHVQEQHPVLGPLRVADDAIPFVRELDNIRVRCSVMLFRPQGNELVCRGSEKGELMFRKYGVSGICVFNLSRLARPGDVLSIDFLQISDANQAQNYLQARRSALVARFGESLSYADMLRGFVLPRIGEALLKRAGVNPQKTLAEEDIAGLAWMLGHCKLEVEGIADPDICQVYRGGLPVSCFDATTMACSDIPGLYAVGEALDVDGPCGGYNLHWAWATGLLAGAAAVNGQ